MDINFYFKNNVKCLVLLSIVNACQDKENKTV